MQFNIFSWFNITILFLCFIKKFPLVYKYIFYYYLVTHFINSHNNFFAFPLSVRFQTFRIEYPGKTDFHLMHVKCQTYGFCCVLLLLPVAQQNMLNVIELFMKSSQQHFYTTPGKASHWKTRKMFKQMFKECIAKY